MKNRKGERVCKLKECANGQLKRKREREEGKKGEKGTLNDTLK